MLLTLQLLISLGFCFCHSRKAHCHSESLSFHLFFWGAQWQVSSSVCKVCILVCLCPRVCVVCVCVCVVRRHFGPRLILDTYCGFVS